MTAGVPRVSTRTTAQCYITFMRKDDIARALPWKAFDRARRHLIRKKDRQNE
jgi:hypothetical protein